MRSKDKTQTHEQQRVLTAEQDALLDLYQEHLDHFFESIKASEKVQVEIETLHLKKILSK
ncbi:hypothetical protein FVR03_01650 [Pontibacter qinzhouensis]|uniref:Uncharacterized protein n=1 Tax=Pontibacter qinzhouensis TaxID=2603253 RepID=A0A5C8KCZ7_9BACT|nr:hypothetical protein [Pontibacter qinzhouensis]TXK52152.1 hypothetical protein FVR03_01650 [Pontibacter qinzhouensis]